MTTPTSRYPPSSTYNTGFSNNSANTFLPGEGFANAHSLEEGDQRRVFATRTPSPTPSEARALKGGVFDWKTLRNWRFWIRKEWTWYYILLIVLVTLTALMTIYHTQIVHWLKPAADWMHDLKFGYLIPIGILFVISFPPLFGHEIVAVLCGLVWGLWIGFGIVAAGTFIGEVGNFYAFKYCCRARGEKLERSKIPYACLAKVVRDGGFKIALIARLSAIPGHFTTAIFSTCGMGIFVFSIAAILSMPKQFITVYLGVILEQSGSGEKPDTKSRIISDSVLAATILVTVLAMWYILHRMNAVKPDVIYERRKARQAKLARGELNMSSTSVETLSTATTDAFNPALSEAHMPLSPKHQQWDEHGNAIGYVGDPQLEPYGNAYEYNNHALSPRPKPSSPRPQPPLYAPQPRRSIGHGHGQLPQDSTDDVSWETSTPNPHSITPPYRTTSPTTYESPHQVASPHGHGHRQESTYQTAYEEEHGHDGGGRGGGHQSNLR